MLPKVHTRYIYVIFRKNCNYNADIVYVFKNKFANLNFLIFGLEIAANIAEATHAAVVKWLEPRSRVMLKPGKCRQVLGQSHPFCVITFLI